MKRLCLLTCLLALPTQAFAQQSCETDADCGEGFACESNRAPKVNLSATPATEPVGMVAATCAGAGDCAAPDPNAPAPDAGPAAEPPESAPSDLDPVPSSDEEPAAETGGLCEPLPWTCESDSECPALTHCDEERCVFELEPCDSESSACSDPSFVCTLVGSSGRDSTEAAPGNVAVAATPPTMMVAPGTPEVDADPTGGNGMLVPPSDESEPDPGGDEMMRVSEPAAASFRACFPPPQPCESDADCAGDWLCVSLPEEVPEAWAEIERTCLPEGVAALVTGRVEVDPETLPEGWAGGADDPSAPPAENGIDGTPPDPGPTDANGLDPDDDSLVTPNSPQEGELELGTQGGSEGSTAGCSLGQPARGSTPWAALTVLFALGWLGRRR